MLEQMFSASSAAMAKPGQAAWDFLLPVRLRSGVMSYLVVQVKNRQEGKHLADKDLQDALLELPKLGGDPTKGYVFLEVGGHGTKTARSRVSWEGKTLVIRLWGNFAQQETDQKSTERQGRFAPRAPARHRDCA